jgi:hypothetical protein
MGSGTYNEEKGQQSVAQRRGKPRARTQTLATGEIEMKILITVLAFIHAMTLVPISSAAESNSIPVFGSCIGTQGVDLAQFVIPRGQIETFLDKVDKKQTAEAVAFGRTIFRQYARLPEGYEDLLASAVRRSRTRTSSYHFNMRQGYRLIVFVDPTRRMVTSCYPTYNITGPKLPIAPQELSPEQTLQLMRNYIEFHDTKHLSIERYCIATRSYGTRSRFIYLTIEGMQPVIPRVFLMDSVYGSIHEADLESLTWLCQREFPEPKTETERRSMLETFLRLHHPEQRIISALTDIPGYAKRKLDSDLASTIRPMFLFEEKDKEVVFIVFTYAKLGGIVRRYRFPFKKRLRLPTCIVLGSDIGDAHYLL